MGGRLFRSAAAADTVWGSRRNDVCGCGDFAAFDQANPQVDGRCAVAVPLPPPTALYRPFVLTSDPPHSGTRPNVPARPPAASDTSFDKSHSSVDVGISDETDNRVADARATAHHRSARCAASLRAGSVPGRQIAARA